VFQILKACTRGMPCDITGIADYQHLEREGGIQWPWPASAAADGNPASTTDDDDHTTSFTERRLFADGTYFHSDGRAKFLFEASRPLTEKPSSLYPFLLLTGRGTASQWHTQTRTSKSAVLRKLYPQAAFVELNPTDAMQQGVKHNDRVVVASQRGSMVATAFLTNNVQPGQVFIPMHYEGTNQLTDAVFDPYSKQPSYKACAVSVTALNQQTRPG